MSASIIYVREVFLQRECDRDKDHCSDNAHYRQSDTRNEEVSCCQVARCDQQRVGARSVRCQEWHRCCYHDSGSYGQRIHTKLYTYRQEYRCEQRCRTCVRHEVSQYACSEKNHEEHHHLAWVFSEKPDKDHKMSRKQYYNTTMIMRQMLEYSIDKGIIEANPFARVKPDSKLFRKIPKKSSETQVFSKTEEAALEEAAWKDFHDRVHHVRQLVPLAVLFMFYTGVRISEVCTLRYEDIEGDEIHIQRMYLDYENRVVDRTKSDAGERYVDMPAKAREIIDAVRARQIEEGVSSGGYLFYMNDGPCPYDAVRKCFAKFCKDLGIINKSSHKARKTYISTLIDAGVNINTIREMVGHADERTTYNSYCFDRTDKSERRKIIEAALA